MTQRAAGIGTIVGTAMKFRLYVFREFLGMRSVASERKVARQKFSSRLLNIVIKKQSALLPSRFHAPRGMQSAVARPAAKQSYFSEAAPRPG